MLSLDGFRGRVAVVTGASSGIGLHIAGMLTRQGCKVAGLDWAPSRHRGWLNLRCDVSREASVSEAFAEIRRTLGRPSILINNAGIYVHGPIEELSLTDWDRIIAVNLTGAFLCSQQVLPDMRQSGYGRLVAISSTAAKTGGWSPAAGYAASKAGVVALAKAVAKEYAPYGVTSNAITPTMIDTPMITVSPEGARAIPVGRYGVPEDVAAIALFLASAHASYITGEVIDVTGGFYID
jgi:2-hydroxycyclohexanecarboxyl-CoA dehydrogenase